MIPPTLDLAELDLTELESLLEESGYDAFHARQLYRWIHRHGVIDFDAMTISEWALREGIVLDVIGRHDPVDWSDDPRAIRRASVQGLARRCRWPEDHSRRVARLALELFDQTRELHGLSDIDRELLEFAAFLHDVGEHVASQGHHKHSTYLIRHGQLRGFSPEEVQLLAALARWHRRGDPKPTDELPLVDEQRLRPLTALLRLADGLDRGRSGAVEHVRVRVGPSLVVIDVEAGGDCELELWGARRKRELFEKLFGRDLEVIGCRESRIGTELDATV